VAQAAEVEVDTETGHVRVMRIVSADDVGKAINPTLVEGTGGRRGRAGAGIRGPDGRLQDEDGRVLTDQLSTYLIPTIWDIPEKVETVFVEVPDPNGPWGARGVGELPFLTVAPAIAAAIHDATGVWIDEFPFTPERVLRALGKIIWAGVPCLYMPCLSPLRNQTTGRRCPPDPRAVRSSAWRTGSRIMNYPMILLSQWERGQG
jgi:CO/xanthine dehydrogenase Mo-binding subunit